LNYYSSILGYRFTVLQAVLDVEGDGILDVLEGFIEGVSTTDAPRKSWDYNCISQFGVVGY
jgi:hypothetical protein